MFRDLTAIAITWGNNDQEEVLVLSAIVSLRSGWRLPMRVQMEDAIFENLLLDWGPSTAAHAVKGVTNWPSLLATRDVCPLFLWRHGLIHVPADDSNNLCWLLSVVVPFLLLPACSMIGWLSTLL